MGKYRVQLKASAEKELVALPAKLVERMFPNIGSLAEEPRPVGCKKLKGGSSEWLIRIGEYRAAYTINDAKLVVMMTRVRQRSEAY